MKKTMFHMFKSFYNKIVIIFKWDYSGCVSKNEVGRCVGDAPYETNVNRIVGKKYCLTDALQNINRVIVGNRSTLEPIQDMAANPLGASAGEGIREVHPHGGWGAGAGHPGAEEYPIGAQETAVAVR